MAQSTWSYFGGSSTEHLTGFTLNIDKSIVSKNQLKSKCLIKISVNYILLNLDMLVYLGWMAIILTASKGMVTFIFYFTNYDWLYANISEYCYC